MDFWIGFLVGGAVFGGIAWHAGCDYCRQKVNREWLTRPERQAKWPNPGED
jgi:hypothetical protein